MGTVGELKVADYLVAVEGLAMIRRFLADPGGLASRAQEVAAIVGGADQPPLSTLIPVDRYEVETGYTRWAPRYDGPNPAIAAEEPVVSALLAGVAPGRALDAACGTGRLAALLAGAGWDVVGVDRTGAMLERARAKIPGATFHAGRLEALPVDDGSVDLVTCGLALTHVDDLGPVFAEFARVLRPGGRVVTTDLHPTTAALGGAAAFPVDDERPDVAAGDSMSVHYVPNLVHPVSEYITAIHRAGLQIRACVEPATDDQVVAAIPSFAAFPDATREAYLGLPYLLVWDLTKPPGA